MRKHLLSGIAGLALGLSSVFGDVYAQDQKKENRTLQTEVEVQETLERRLATQTIDPQEEKMYYVVLNGSKNDHQPQSLTCYKLALQQLRVPRDDIFFLSNEIEKNKNPVRFENTISAQGTKENVISVLNYLAQTADENDIVYVDITGHGVGNKKVFDHKTWIQLDNTPRELITRRLPNGSIEKFKMDLYYHYMATLRFDETSIKHIVQTQMNQDEYATLLAPIRAQIINEMDFCYSDGINEALAASPARVISMSNTDRKHATLCQFYSEAFFEGLESRAADKNNDKQITTREIWEYAMKAHKEAEKNPKHNFKANNWSTEGTYVTSQTSVDEVVLLSW